MPGPRLFPLACLLLAATSFSLAGCGAAESTWHGRDLSLQNPPWHNVTLEPGWSLRLDVVAHSRSEVAWDWFADERLPVSYSLHRHGQEGMEQVYAVQDTDDRGRVMSEFAALHSHIWTNGAAQAVELWFRIANPVGGGTYEPGEDPKADVCRSSASAASSASLC